MNDLTDKYVGVNSPVNPNLRFLEGEIPNYRILAMPGGTRSGKSYSVIQWMWRQMDRFSGVKYSIARHTLPSLKATILEDFIEIGRDAGLYNPLAHHETDKIYKHNGNVVDYFSSDDDEKVRGRKRDVLYLNEGPEMHWKVVQQLLWRTTSKIIIDYNPSYPESWVYDKILTRSDCAFITTTYRDNPHLTAAQLSEIDWMRENDPDTYQVYGLGQRGELKGQVYKNWKEIKELPSDTPPVYLIDFGYTNDPAFLGKFCHQNRALYGKECAYAAGMDNIDIAMLLHCAGADQNSVIVAESAEPKSVGELRIGWALELDYIKQRCLTTADTLEQPKQPGGPSAKAMAARLRAIASDSNELISLKLALTNGYPVLLAPKGPDSVMNGIQKVKQFEVFITVDSVNMWREYRTYRWVEDPKTGQLLNKPVDAHNHGMDGLRYYALSIGHYF